MNIDAFFHWIFATPLTGAIARFWLESSVILGFGLLMTRAVRPRSAATASTILRWTLIGIVICLATAGFDYTSAQNKVSAGRVPIALSTVSAILLLRVAAGIFALARLRRRARSASIQWIESSGLCSPAVRIASPPVLASRQIRSPCVIGLLRAYVVVPEESRAARHDVMVHEQAHIKRKDCFWQLAAELVCAVCWYQPLVWMLAREMKRSADEVCDDFVVAYGCDRSEYAAELVSIARQNSGAGHVMRHAIAMARPGSNLSNRVERIMDQSREVALRGSRIGLVMVALVFAIEILAVGLVGRAIPRLG